MRDALGSQPLRLSSWALDIRESVSGTTIAVPAVMLWTIAVVLIILWLLGFVSSYTMGGFIHILLVIAVIVIVIRLIQGRKVL